MKHCPSADCPHVRAHGNAAEYRDDIACCADCGARLEEGPAPEASGAAEGGTSPFLSKRVAVSLAAVMVAFLATRAVIPGLDPTLVAMMYDHGSTENLSVVALGLQPFLSAMVLVELAALLVPRWRSLRRTGPAERAKLFRAALVLTPVLALFQGFGVAMYIEGLDGVMGIGAVVGWGPRLFTTITLAAGTAFLIGLAALVHRFGAGNGVSVLLAGTTLPVIGDSLLRVGRAISAEEIAPFGAAIGLAALALPAFATWRLARRSPPQGISDASERVVRLPSSGAVPISAAASLLVLPMTLTNLGVPFIDSLQPTPGSTASLIAECVFVVALCGLFSVLFHLPRNVQRVVGHAVPRPELMRGIMASAAYLLALVLSSFVAMQSLPPGCALDAVAIAVLTAVVMDVAGELKAIHGGEAYFSVWPIHQVYAAPVAMRTLQAAGIKHFARGLHHRTLLQFYGPFVPIEIMVPESETERARALLRDLLIREEVPTA